MPRNQRRRPALAYFIASKLIPESYREELLGDLLEIYEERLNSSGVFIAYGMFWIEVIHLTAGFTPIRKMKTQNNNYMIKKMLKVAWRNAIRQKQSSILNIAGLTIGIITFLVIGLFVHHQSSFDKFHEKGDRIYRIDQPDIWGDWQTRISSTGPNVAIALREDTPEFEEVTRLMDLGSQIINIKNANANDLSFKENRVIGVEDNFFSVFTFSFYEGDKTTALNDPNSLVITKETARRYFGTDKPLDEALGRQIEIKQWDGKWKTFQVKGIMADISPKSHLQFDMLISMNSYQEQIDRDGWKWIWTAFSTYGLVKPGVDIEALTEKIQALPPKWAAPTTERIFNQTFEEFTAGNDWRLELQPMCDIYLSDGSPTHRFGPVANPLYVKIFSSIGLLVLILSCINFMNLSTAQSTKRAKEVGVRKVLGSNRKSLIYQFVFESILIVLASTILALFLCKYAVRLFNNIADLDLRIDPYLSNPYFYLIILLFVILLGIISGSYPALYLSSFKPLNSLKGKVSQGFIGVGIRNSLVVIQFSISITLIIFSVFVQKQLDYTSSMDLGFSRDNVLQIHNIEQLGFDTESFKESLLQNPAFSGVGKSFGIPPFVWSGDRYKSTEPDAQVIQFSNLRTEEDYIDLLGVEILAGRNFSKENINDKYKILINESAIDALGWGRSGNIDMNTIVGKKIKLASGDEDEFEIIGIVRDFNFNNQKQDIRPLVIIHQNNDNVWDYGRGLSYYSIRLNLLTVNSPEIVQAQIDYVEEQLAKFDATIPFEYSFLDEGFESSFKTEQQMSLILTVFTFMALLIACLGLFGLSSFSAELRIKEMGIRKVLGANSTQITLLFSSDFLKLILIAILIASPTAYFFVRTWLEDFAFRTQVTLLPFVLTGVTAIVIALMTISYQSIKTAWHNPVEFLKEE